MPINKKKVCVTQKTWVSEVQVCESALRGKMLDCHARHCFGKDGMIQPDLMTCVSGGQCTPNTTASFTKGLTLVKEKTWNIQLKAGSYPYSSMTCVLHATRQMSATLSSVSTYLQPVHVLLYSDARTA